MIVVKLEKERMSMAEEYSMEALGLPSKDVLGLLRIRVRRGINLAVRDIGRSSDPYVVVECGSLRVKTSVVRDSCNPVWDEDLTIYIKDVDCPIVLSVFDKDTFTLDDVMGNALIDIKPYLECLKMGLHGLPEGQVVRTVEASSQNCLAETSFVVWNKGKITQQMILRLRDVECGEMDLQIEWLDVDPTNEGFHKS